MPDTYKIELAPIKNVEADKSTKDLAYKLSIVNNAIVVLAKTLDKSISAQKTAQKTGGADPKAIRNSVLVAEKMEKAAETITKSIKELSKSFKDLPKVITDAMSTASTTVKTYVGKTGADVGLSKTDPEIKALTRELVQLRRNIGKSATYQTGGDAVVKAIDKLIKELSAQKRDISKLSESVRNLAKASGMKEAPRAGEIAKTVYEPTTDVKLFGKALKDMGGEFEKIKRELADKIVVSVDLETSAARFGKDAAANFITQIAYQKGTLAEIMSGAAKKESIYIKPPAKTKAEYMEKLTTLPSGKKVDEKTEAEFKRIAIPFKKLTGKGSKEIGEALHSFAESLKDAEVILGQNLADFDIRILQQHFDKAGIKIDTAVDKFVDTVKLSRHNFPERMGKNLELAKFKPHGLERFDKDLKLAGIEIKSTGDRAHDAAYDLELTSKLLNALNNSTEELAAAQSNTALVLKKLLENLSTATQDAVKKVKDTGQTAVASMDAIDALSGDITKASKVMVKRAVEVNNLSKVKSAIQTRTYKETVVRPMAEAGRQYGVEGTAAGEVGNKILTIWGDLAKSLFDLQKNMVNSLEKGMKKGIEVMKDASGQAFKLGEGGREWEVKIADVRGLRRELSSTFREQVAPGSGPNELVKAFKAAFVRREMSTPVDKEDMAAEVYKEVGSLTKESVAKMGDIVKELYKGIQAKTTTEKEIGGRGDLQDLYKGVALEAKAEREIMAKFVKSLTVPAAKITSQGTLSFETKYGSEKALANFATITTGFEKLVKEMELLGAPAVEVSRLMQEIGKAPLRPQPGTEEMKKASNLAEKLQKRVLQLGGREELKVGYKRAVALREMERGAPQKEALESVTGAGLSELVKRAHELNVTALDAARALDEIKFENFYDILDKMFQVGKTPLLEKQSGSIINLGQSERSLRKMASVVNDLMGLMPMIEPGKPKRREYDEQSVKVLTKAFTSQLRPEEQKKRIIDVGLLWEDLTSRAKKLDKGVFEGKEYLGRPQASSMDLSDAASSALKQFNLDMSSNLKYLDKTMTSMSLANIRALAPFQEFASIQRQMSYATSAIGGGLPGGGEFKTPSLVSSKEKGLIESGRYGGGGYGLNVLTELRNTAATFEDQIVISGKLAKAFTEITTNLVRPAATYLEQQRITEVAGGVQKMTPRAAKMRTDSEKDFKKVLADVADQFQEILGVPEKYRGRADIAEISKKIEPVMREHRGQNIEVQTAKLTETFLNYFGRKLSTRFGTKGVSVTPEYGELPEGIKGIEDVTKFIKAGFKTGVATGPGLGAAKVPKSVGQMMSEIFEKTFGGLNTAEVSMELHNQLLDSGNKFVIEMFKDAAAGLVTEEEAKTQAALFDKVSKIWKESFGTTLATGPKGIKEIKGEYKKRTGRDPFDMQPIEARISSKGIAKRGLMPEVLEGLVNNLIGSTSGTTTLIDKIGKDALTETKEARARLNEYLEALGFKAFKDLDKVIERLKTPDMSAEAIDKLRKFESQWNVYTEVVDEFGKRMQSFVAPKFLQIIEEPTRYKEWSSEDIGKGLKGAKLDFQSFAAMAGVFGEGSSMMKELAASTSITSKEGWELLRTFQMLDPKMKDLKDTMMKALPTVKLEDLKGFTDATGTIEDFKDTIFDIGKYPTPFKLKIPSAQGKYEEMPMPGASLRTTYREQLLGKGAPTNVARYLANLVESAKAVEDLSAAAVRGGMGLSEAVQQKFADTIKTELTLMLTNAIKEFRKTESKGALTPQNVQNMQETIDKFKKALSTTRRAPGVYQEASGITELEAVESYASTKAKGQYKYSNILSRISDILIGANPESLRAEMERINTSLKKFEESGTLPSEFKKRTPQAFKHAMGKYTERTRLRGEAPKAFDLELQAGNLDEFAQKVGIDVSESVKEALQKKLESLSRAKISYFKAMGQEIFGKKKGIEQTFFQRVTPAVTGKAISAITDKTDELKTLLDTLSGAKYDLDLDIPGVDNLIERVKALNKEHKEYVAKAKKLGLPVLKEGEIAIPEAQAEKIKVRTGKSNEIETNLAALIRQQEKVFVESIRFPFTGTLSVQPHKAKLMEDMGLDLGSQSIAVPGAPQLDLEELNSIINTLKEYVGTVPKEERKHLGKDTLSLLQQREQAWAEGTGKGAEKANALTSTITGLLKVINDATPKFANLEQKLDFDGDALFVHTGQLEESRKEIGLHFKALGEEVTSVRNLFRSLFTTVDEGDVSTFVEMGQVFGKKHPKEKGFEFLTKPYIRKEMKGLDLSEVMSSLFSYEDVSADVKGTDQWKKSVSDWSKKFVTNDILPQVFNRLGVSGESRAAYTAMVPGAESGIPEATTTSSELDTRISGLAKELVRRQLWEKRYSDAITGQLYKLHTGQTVEGVSRIARVSEIETGFGKGLTGKGKGAEPSADFLKAFPKESIALGGRPVQAFATRVNEIMRFVIQKGMDVKHAGVEAVGTKIIANIGKTSGAEIIMQAMEESKDQFEDLADFNAQIANEVKLRLGAVSTEGLKTELKRFEPDVDVASLNLDRQSIVNRIIKHVDLQAVFEELFKQIKRTAVKGMSKTLQEKLDVLPAGAEKMKLMRQVESAGGTKRFAEEQIAKEAGDKGINLVKHITTTLQPLYKMRTSMETMGTAAQRAGIKVEPTEMALPAGAAGKELSKQFDTAAKAAHALSKAMESSVATPGRGIYTSMVVGALKQRYKELEELQKLDQDAQKYAGKFEYAFTDVMDANKLAAKVWTESKELAGVQAPSLMPADYDVTGWLDQLNAVKKIASQKLGEISEKAGLPPMVPEEKSLLASEFEAKFGARTFKSLKDVIGKGMVAREEQIVPEDLEAKAEDAYAKIVEFVKFQVSFVEQLRRVSEIAKTVPTQKFYLKEAFPDFDPVKEFKPSFEGVDASTEFMDKEKAVTGLLEDYYKQQTTTSLGDIQEAIRNATIPTTAAAENLSEEALTATDEITEAITKAVVKRKRDVLQYLESKAEGAKPLLERPLMDIYRASGVEAGGAYGGGTQQEAIIKSMVGIKSPSMLLESTGLRGQAIHRKIQKEFVQKYPGTEIEQPMEDFENKITGHFDILYEKSGQKILADIKTVYSTKQFNRLKEISAEIEKRNITIQQKVEELKASKPTDYIEKNVVRRLENYLSQVNIYLKNTGDAVGEIIITSSFDPEDRVTIPMGKFDPELFNKDIEAVNKARDKVTRILASISATGGLPPSLLKEYPKLYEQLSKRLEKLGSEGFAKAMPTRPVGEVGKPAEEILGRLSDTQQEMYERVSKEYLDMFKELGGPGAGGAEKSYKMWFASGAGAAGAPPAAPPPTPPTGPGGGDGFDDDEFRKKIEVIIARLKGSLDPESSDIHQLVRALDEAEERATAALRNDDKDLAEALSNLANKIRETIETSGYGMKSARKMADLYAKFDKIKSGVATGTTSFSKYRAEIERVEPDRPEAMHKNLQALYEAAIRVNKLADSEDIQKFGPDIAKLLMETAEKGPADISPKLSEVISQLPPAKKGGMSKIWMLYKKAVSEYFLKRLDDLLQEVKDEAGTPEGRKAYVEYEQVLERYLSNIRGTIGRTSDIFTTEGPSGKKTEFVDTELARLVGVYKTRKQIEEKVRQTSPMAGEFKPIMDTLVGDLDPAMIESMATPLEKVRTAFKMLTSEDQGLKALLGDMEMFKRMGPEAVKAWDFEKLVRGITQLRGGLQAYNRLQIGGFGGAGDDYTEQTRKNVEDTVKYLKQLEQMFSSTGPTASPFGAVGVPPFLDPETQKLLHRRNIVKTREAFQQPEDEGGMPRGQRFTYRYKIVDPATKQTIENTSVEFKKLGDVATNTGQDIGVFSEKWEDMIKSFQNKRGIGQAFKRVVMWGTASRTIYGLVSALQNMVNTIADVESGMAVLRQVMSPLETDFEQVQGAALGFAKQFGLPIRQVIDSMRVFAQQGLAQQEVIDRTRTSMLAANTTTLNAGDATEAITAAMKVYGREGESTIRFLDSWTEVEARHAITSMDLANGLKKAAAVAKTSGVSFDELNAIITGIGETSRQTGKEIGTSLRFMFRRMQADKGPKELGKVGIPVLAPTGELRKGFDILGDLAAAWDTLTSAQRLNLAQSIGGRRHYNSLLILMDHWDDALDTLTDSINSKGAAERRNAIVMKTYAKQVQQVRAAVSELQVQFGKAFLPIAKMGLQGFKFLVEALTNIPPAVKGAMAGFSALFVLMTKGSGLVEKFMNTFVGGKAVFSDFFGSMKNEFKKGVFEVTGKKMGGLETKGLKTFMDVKSSRDMESFLGKMVFMSAKAGRAWNSFLADLTKGTASASMGVAKSLDFISAGLFELAGSVGGKGGPVGGIVAALIGSLGVAADLGEFGFDKIGKMFGITSQQMALLTRESTGVVGALGPMVGSFFALKPLLGKAYDGFRRLTVSASDYEKSIDGIRRKTSGELSDIRNIGQQYNSLQRSLDKVTESRKPEVKKRAIEREEYKDPLQELGTMYSNTTKFANQLSDVNLSLVSSFDKFGNAVLKSTDNLQAFVTTLASAKMGEMLGTELDVLGKYVEDLTKTTGMETFKKEFKTLLGEIPVIGGMLAKSIKIAPAKELDTITNKMNKLLGLRSKYSLTTTFDVDIEGYKKKLDIVRSEYNKTYDDFKRVLTELPTEGLAPNQITEALARPEFKKGFETIVAFEPKLQTKGIKGKITAEDILGTEVMKKIHPEVPLDFTAALTKGLLMQRNVVRRSGEAFAGDVVLFTENVADKYDIAGNQAILKMQKTTDGMVTWTAEYFDKEIGSVAEVPFEKVDKYVESIFPAKAMQERLQGNIEVLQEFVAGAEAGLRGIGKKDFKRDFNLGSRFFGGVPTTTLIQSSKGYEPSKGYGEVPFKQDWSKWIQTNFIKPMSEYRLILEQVSKMQLETGEALMSPGLRDDIEKLQNILKNNQIVIQYRAAHEDLMKTMSESQRILEENIAIERNRSKMIVQTSGYLKGFAEDFGDITTGVQKFADLSAQQRLAFSERDASPENRVFDGLRRSFKEDSINRESLVSQINELDKTLIAVGEISKVSEGFGISISPEDLNKYAEEIAKAGDRGTGLLLNETKNITSNTSQTVDRLDQLLEQGGDEGAIERLITKIPGGFLGPEMLVKRIEAISERRNKALDRGNTDLVANFDRAIDGMVTKLIGEVGTEKALKMVQQNKPIFGRQDFTPAEFIQRSLGNIDFGGFSKAMERAQPGITKTKEFTKLIKLQGDQRDTQIVSNKTINQLLSVYSTIEHFNKVASNKQVNKLDEQIDQLKDRRKEATGEGDVQKLTSQIEELTSTRKVVAKKASDQAIRELIAPISMVSQELAKSLGMTDRQLRLLGGTVASTYGAWKLWEKLTGEPVPEYLEDLGKKSKEAVKNMTKSGFSGKAWKAWYGVKDLVYGKSLGEELKKAEEKIKKEKIFTGEEIKKAQEKIILGGEKAGESEVVYKGQSTLREKVDAAIKEMQRRKAEKGSTTEEKILNENESQTGVLHGIFEKVKDTASNTRSFTEALHGEMKKDQGARQEETKAVVDNVDKLRTEYLENRGIVSDPFKKVIAALVAATATGYLSEKRGDKGRTNELENRAEKQVDLINDIIAKYPDVIAKAIEEFRSRTGVGSVERAAPETELVQRAVNVSDFEDEMVNRLQSVRGRMAAEYDTVNKGMEEAVDKIARLEMAEQLKMQLEQMEDAIKTAKIAEDFENNIIGQIGGVLAGISLPKTTLAERDVFNIPALARVKAGEQSGDKYTRFMDRADAELDKIIIDPFRKAGAEVVALFHGLTFSVFANDLADIVNEFEKIGAERDILVNQAREMNQELSGLEGKDLTDIERERYKMLEHSLGNVKDRVYGLNSSLQKMAVQLEKAEVAEQVRIGRLQAFAQISAQVAVAGAEYGVAGGRGMATGVRGMTAVPSMDFGPRSARQMTPEQRAYFENTKTGLGLVRGSRSLFKKYAEEEVRVKGLTSRYTELSSKRQELIARMDEESRSFNKVRASTRQEYELVSNQMKELRSSSNDAAEELSKLSEKLYVVTEAARFQIEVEERRASAIDRMSEVTTRAKFGAMPFGALGKAGVGPEAFGEIPTGKALSELTASQYLYVEAVKQGNDPLRKEIELYQSVIQTRQSEIESLVSGKQKAINFKTELEQAVDAMDYERATSLSNALKNQNNANKDLEESIKSLTTNLKQLSKVQTALQFAGLIQSFETMKRSFKDTEIMERFRQMGEGFDKMLGGKHPLAPVVPTYDMLKAGVPEERLFKMNKYEAQMASLVASRKLITGEDRARIKFQKKIDLTMWDQNQEDAKLMRGKQQAETLRQELMKHQRKALEIEDPDERLRAISTINKSVIELNSQMGQASDIVGETSTGAAEYKGFALEGVIAPVKEMFKSFGEGPIVEQLMSSNSYLQEISQNTAVQKTGVVSDMYRGTWQEKLYELFKGAFSRKDVEKKQTGGIITGSGGPREDRVPIMASPGEFVVKASSAKRLGSSALNYMNETGSVPGLAEGGSIRNPGAPLMTPGALMHKRWMEKPEEYRTDETTSFQRWMPKVSKGLVEKAPWLPLGEHVPEWAKKHPQLYGAFGAAKIFTPYQEAEMAMGGSELGLLSLAILPFLGLGTKVIKGIGQGTKLGVKSLLKLFSKGTKGVAKKPITKATATGKYVDEISEMIRGIGTEGGGTNIGKAIGVKAGEGDVKVLGTLARLNKQLKSEFKTANKPDMSNAEFNEVIKLGSQVQAVREGQEFAKVMLAIKRGKTPPITSSTEKAIQYVKEGGLHNVPKIDFFAAKSKSAFLMGAPSKSIGKPAEAVFDAAKQDEAILSTLRLNRQYKEIQEATGLEAKFKSEQFVDLLNKAPSIPKSEKALSEAIDQIGVVANTVGAKHLNLTEIGAASLDNPMAFADFLTPKVLSSKQGALRFSKEHWRDPKSIREAFEFNKMAHDMGMGGQFANVDPKEAFRYIPSHEVGGHAFTTIPTELASKEALHLRDSMIKSFTVPGSAIKKPVSEYAKTSAPEAMAETAAAAYHMKSGATKEVLELQKALGIGFAGGGWVDSLKDMWAEFMGEASAEGDTASAPEVLRRIKEREQKIKEAVAEKQGGGWIDSLKDMWSKFMPAASAEGETVSAAEALRRAKEREQQQKDAIDQMFDEKPKAVNSYADGGWIDNLKDMWSKFMPEAPAGGETVSASEVARRIKEREQKIKDAVEGMQGGGWVDSLKEMWAKFMPKAPAEGETFSADEVARRIKEREQKIKDIVEEKQSGGWIKSLKAMAEGKVEDVKGIYGNIKESVLRAFTSPEGTIEKEALTGELTKKRVEEALGEKISSYRQGTPFVPQTQLAMVHKGEGIIPAEYNTGGFVSPAKFQAGGAVNPLKSIVGVGEEIGEAIVKKIEEASIKAPEIPPLEIGNLDELQSILGEGAVGAERGQTKLDQFVGKVDDELRRFDDELVSTSEKITILETNVQTKIDGDIRELKTTVTALDRKVTDIYTQTDRDVDLAAEKSELEAKLIKTIDELKTLDLIPMKSNILLLRHELDSTVRASNALAERVTSNTIQIGLGK